MGILIQKIGRLSHSSAHLRTGCLRTHTHEAKVRLAAMTRNLKGNSYGAKTGLKDRKGTTLASDTYL